MFAFLKSQPAFGDSPFESPADAAAWFRALPSHDDAARQRQVQTALQEVARRGRSIECATVIAIEFVDTAGEGDRKRLIAQYAASIDRSPQVAVHLWESLHATNAARTAAYEAALAAALGRPRNASYQSLLPHLLARLVRCIGSEARLRAFHYQRSIPAKSRRLHDLYRIAMSRGIERMRLLRTGAESSTLGTTVEQEYVAALLDQRINTGNLRPQDIELVSEYLREWSRDVTLDIAPRSEGGFVIDLDSEAGLVGRVGDENGARFRFVDVTPLLLRLEHEIATLQAQRSDGGRGEQERERRIAVLSKTWPALSMRGDTELRRHRREASAARAEMCVGFTSVYNALASRDDATLAADGALATGPDAVVAAGEWTIVERSVSSMRVRVQGSRRTGPQLAVGALVAIRPCAARGWIVGVVRRLVQATGNALEAGLSIVSDHVVAATLHTPCARRDDMQMTLDGKDLWGFGATFRGLCIRRQKELGMPWTAGTLIVPTTRHDVAHIATMAAGDEVRSLVFGDAIEQHADWTWTMIDEVSHAARA